MKKLLLYLLLLPSLGFGQSLYEYQNLSKYRVRVGELVLNGEKIRPVASDSGQVLQFDGTHWKNTTKNGESDPFYKIDSLALNRAMRAFVRDSGNYAWWIDTTQTTGAGIASRYDNSLKQNLLVNSAGLAGAISDETGTMKAVFSDQPTFTGSLNIKSSLTTESAPLGSELTDTITANWTKTTGWTGYGSTGFVHSSGTTVLSRAINNAIGDLYQISWTVTERTLGSFTIGLGGETSNVSFTASGTYAPKTLSTNGALIFTPTTDFNGRISAISVRRITGPYPSVYNILDNTGVPNIEIRASTSALNNQFIGKGSGNLNTTGAYNTANGFGSLYSNTTGQQNTANGFGSLYSNTTGQQNTANGVNSLRSNTTGQENTANGVNSLRSNTTGQQNTANGVNSLYSNTIGAYNAANGFGSLYSNTTGAYNAANGVNSLRSNTTGQQNAANGSGSLYSNTTGAYNTANGFGSLYSNTTGQQNTANGVNSLRSNTTGQQNTANGVNSGRWITGFSTPNTTSDYCVFIGDSTAAKADNDQNEIVIGHSAVGNGSNTATYGNSKITNHVFTAGNLGVAGEITKGSEVSKVPGVMFTQTADKTISNTTTETTLVGTGVGSTSLPALSLIAGKTVRMQLSGYLSCGANDSTTINIKVGATTLVSSKVKIPVSMTNTEFIADFTFTCRTTGATGTVIGQGSTTLFEGQAFTTTYSRALQMTSTATVNTTVSNTLDATYKFNAARATNSITVTNLSIEILN